MMTKHAIYQFILGCFFIFSSLTGFAQIVVKAGPEIKTNYGLMPIEMIRDSSGVSLMSYGVHQGSPSYSYVNIKHFDTDYKMDHDGGDDRAFFEQRGAFCGSVEMAGNIYFFGTSFIEKGKKGLNYYHFNPSTLKSDYGEQIAQSTYLSPYEDIGGRDILGDDFSIVLSPDSSKLLITNSVVVNGKTVYEEQVFDSEMKLIWKKTIVPSFALPGVRCLFSSAVDDSGNAYSIEHEYKSKYQHLFTTLPVTDHDLHFTIVSDNGTKVITRKIENKGKQILDCDLKLSESGQVFLIGFYSNTGAFDFTGTFFESIDPKSGKTTLQTTTDLPVEYVTTLKINGGKKDKMQVPLHQIIFGSKGEITIVATVYFMSIYKPEGIPLSQVTDRYTMSPCGSIIVIRFDEKGNIQWQNCIQRSVFLESGPGDFISSIVNDELIILFNDLPKNLNLPSTESPKTYGVTNSQIIILNRIDKSGKLTQSQFFTPPKKDYYLNTVAARWYNNTIYMWITNGDDKAYLASSTF